MRILLIGFGSVGQEFARILTARPGTYPGVEKLDAVIVGIVTRSHGCWANLRGIDLPAALAEMASGGFSSQGADFSRLDALQAVDELDYDVLVELSSLEIQGRGEPAISHLRKALERGKHCVTANKGPLAFAFQELSSTAREKGVRFLYESTVLDGAPVFSLARCGLRPCRLLQIDGIVNSTSNFVISQVEKGASFEESLELARRKGFTETDPSLDLNGWDAAAKVCALANVLMDTEMTPEQVERSDWHDLLIDQARRGGEMGFRLKQIIRVRREFETVRAGVYWEKLPPSHPFAAVTGTGSILRIKTDLMAPFLIEQENPGVMDTACGVLNDLLEIQKAHH